MKKWEIENSKLPRSKQRSAPQKPTILPSINNHEANDRNRFNQAAYEAAQSQLIPCSKCGRTFATDRIDIHERNCKLVNSKIPQRSSGTKSLETDENSSGYSSGKFSKTPNEPEPVKPKTVVCYICGREFGTQSISYKN